MSINPFESRENIVQCQAGTELDGDILGVETRDPLVADAFGVIQIVSETYEMLIHSIITSQP